MNMYDALLVAKLNGTRIRRKDWPKRFYCYFEEHFDGEKTLILTEEDGKGMRSGFPVRSSDLVAEWEVSFPTDTGEE